MNERDRQELADIQARHPEARIDLIRARKERGVKQYEAAAILNVAWPYYSMIELGEILPYAELAARIERLLGVNVLKED